uniref:Uncharacterized protein n=1 Tax=Panagrolaimus davidi TaxID=227884 RepID=A0A914QW42_9BILA
MTSEILVAAKITPIIGDMVVCINFGNNEMTLAINKFTSNGYKTLMTEVIEEKYLEVLANCFSNIMKTCYMRKMILTTTEKDEPLLKKFVTILKSSKIFNLSGKLMIIDCEKLYETKHMGTPITEMAKWVSDRNYVDFHILPIIPKTVEILGVFGNRQKKLIAAEKGSEISFTESVVLGKSVQHCLMKQLNGTTLEFLETLKMDQNCHRRKITLLFESECFPELKIESIIIPEIKELQKKLNGICDMKTPVIGFFDNSAVICVYKNGKYKFLDSWNGLYGNELFINFEESKAKYGMESIKADKTKMSSVVYDNLIKIISMPSDKIVVKEEWKFVITKNAENPVLIEFVNQEGRKQAGTPSFLMAMLLKEMIKRIKNKMNEEKPKEIGFCFFDKMFEDEKQRVENGLKEACELLKIHAKFIDV